MGLTTELVGSSYFTHWVCVLFVFVFIAAIWEEILIEIPYSGVPLVGRNRWDILNRKAKARFAKSARSVLAEGFREVRDIQIRWWAAMI